MLETDRRIYKINGKDRFLDITEFFSAGKVCLQMSTYNKNNQAGSRITNTVKTYLNIDDLAYFAHVLEDEKMLWERIKVKYKSVPKGGDIVVASFFSGSERNGQVYSRQLTIEKGSSLPVILRARECPGVKTQTGAVVPDKARRSEGNQIIIGMSLEMCYKLAFALKRAISIYDRWTADRVLGERLDSIRYRASQTESSPSARQPEYTQNTYNGQMLQTPEQYYGQANQYNNAYNFQYTYNNPDEYQAIRTKS